MQSTIHTIGFTQKTAEEFFRLLKEAGIRKLVDIRENRGGQLAGFAKFPDIAFFVDRILGVTYTYEPRLAPSVEIRQAYRTTRDWAAYEKSFLELMQARGMPAAIAPEEFEGSIALLCSEPTAEKCHRRLVAEMLADEWNRRGHQVSVAHLVLQRDLTARRRRTGKRDDRTDSL
jgi:uncharacterized protein (DUF488 family)